MTTRVTRRAGEDYPFFMVSGRTSSPEAVPALTASSAYAAGNVVGSLLTFPTALDVAGLGGILQSATLLSKSVQTAGFKLYLFKANPTASTFTNKAAPALAPADFDKLIEVVSFATADSGLGTHSIYTVNSIGRSFLASQVALYGVLTTIGTPTFASASDLTVRLGVLQD